VKEASLVPLSKPPAGEEPPEAFFCGIARGKKCFRACQRKPRLPHSQNKNGGKSEIERLEAGGEEKTPPSPSRGKKTIVVDQDRADLQEEFSGLDR